MLPVSRLLFFISSRQRRPRPANRLSCHTLKGLTMMPGDGETSFVLQSEGEFVRPLNVFWILKAIVTCRGAEGARNEIVRLSELRFK